MGYAGLKSMGRCVTFYNVLLKFYIQFYNRKISLLHSCFSLGYCAVVLAFTCCTLCIYIMPLLPLPLSAAAAAAAAHRVDMHKIAKNCCGA